MSKIILLNKPFQVLSQFRDIEGRGCLADYIKDKGFYPAGRLDYDSEGLLLLTNDGALQHRIADPKHKMTKTYWVQVEGTVEQEHLENLQKGVVLKGDTTRPAQARLLHEQAIASQIWPRTPPIRQRQSIPTTWVELTISEGRNRQVRRMTAAVGLPTLRLIRTQIGPWRLNGLAPGNWRKENVNIPAPAQGNHIKNSTVNPFRPKHANKRKRR